MSRTAASARPNINFNKCRPPNKATDANKRAKAAVIKINCPAAWQADRDCFFPIYWEHTTAPPVARADKSCMIKILMESTSATPETAASPTAATITTSTMPTNTARICSTIKGPNNWIKSFLENNIFLTSFI